MKKILIAVCMLSLFIIGATGCTQGDTNATEASAPTQASTQAPTQEPTQAPTQAPTQEPTEQPTEASTSAEVTVENSTFSVSIVAPIPTEATESATLATGYVSDENFTTLDGKWSLSYYEQPNGQHSAAQRSITYTFNNDGTFTVNNNGNIMTGVYTFDGTNLSYTADANGEQGTFIYDKTNETLSDTDENSDMSAVFIKN